MHFVEREESPVEIVSAIDRIFDEWEARFRFEGIQPEASFQTSIRVVGVLACLC